jgi:hypothetical protein
MGQQLLHRRLTGVRCLASHQVIEGATQAVNVRAVVGLASVDGLFRRHEVHGPHDAARLGQVAGGSVGRLAGRVAAGQAHVENLEVCATRPRPHEEVTRLDVAVNDTGLVRVFQSASSLDDQVHGMGDGQRPILLDPLAQVHPLDIFHDQEMDALMLAGVTGRHDVGMVELGSRLDFALEAFDGGGVLGDCGRQHLDGDFAGQFLVPGLEDHAHAARAQLVQDKIVVEYQPADLALTQHARLIACQFIPAHKFQRHLPPVLLRANFTDDGGHLGRGQ